MSGEKRRYTRIEESELRRLRQQESRLRSVQNDLPDRLNRVRTEARREFQQRLAPLEERARRQEQEAKKLKSNLARQEQETRKRLRQQQKKFQSSLKDSETRQRQAQARESARLESAMKKGFEEQRQEYLQITQKQRREYTQLIEQQDAKFEQLVAEERQAREQAHKQLQQQVDAVVSDIQNKATLAQDLLDDVELVWQGIDRDYQHQRFAPGRLDDLERELELARSNIQAGVSEAAIATTQKTYLSLTDLRIELEQKEQEWLLLYNAAREDLQSLIAETQANRHCEVEVGQGSEIETFQLEVDYWTDGALSLYEQELSQLGARLKAEESKLTTEQLKELADKIEALQPQLGDIVERAKLAILSSQLRVEIADRVVEVLQEFGYGLEDSEADAIYEGEDQRAAYVVKVKNIAGDEVVTVISPDREFGANSISINTFSQTLVDEQSTQQNAQAIFERLNQAGIEGSGQLECIPEARQDYRDLTSVRQRQPVSKPAQLGPGLQSDVVTSSE